MAMPPLVKLTRATPGPIRVHRLEDSKRASAMHGLARALLNNAIVGVSEGFRKSLRLVGVGYTAKMLPPAEAGGRPRLSLQLGYCHPVIFEVPQGIDVTLAEEGVLINLESHDKHLIGHFAAIIRDARPPEPYKGHGVRYEGEVIKLKQGKRGR